MEEMGGKVVALVIVIMAVAEEVELDQTETGTFSLSTTGTESVRRRFSGRVLLAEDGADNQRVIERFLSRAGLEVERIEELAPGGLVKLIVARAREN